MRNFLLLVNILALTLPFLAAQMQSQDPAVAEVQNQEQLACREKNEQVFDRKRVLPTPIHYVMSSKTHYDPSYYQYRPVVAVSPYVPYQYFVRLLVLRPPVQLSNWQVLPNIPQPVGVPHPNPRPSFLAIPTNANQDTNAIPATNADQDTNAIPATHAAAPVEPTPVPAAEPTVSTVANPEVSTVASTATETATVPVTSPVVEKH